MNHLLPYTIGLAGLLAYSPVSAKKTVRNVNFIVVYLDDMGYGDLTLIPDVPTRAFYRGKMVFPVR